MKIFFASVFLFFTITGSAQIVFPKGFRQIKGERGSGLDDVYTNGKYSFLFHRESFFYEENNEGSHKYKGNGQ
jgi:hypothetical protein